MAQSLINAANSWTSKDETVMKIDLERYQNLKDKVDALFADGISEPETIIAAVYFSHVSNHAEEFSNILQEIEDLSAKVR